MLLDCTINNKIWEIVGDTLKTKITCKQIVIGYGTGPETYQNTHIATLNYCTTLIAYLIYKYRVLKLNKKIGTSVREMYSFLESELNFRIKILKINNSFSEHSYLDTIRNQLKQYLLLHIDPG